MERRGEEMGGNNNNNPMSGASVSVVKKLPLAPTILSTTPSDHRRLNHAMVSIRRGSSIFSPTQQTLEPAAYNIPPPPLPPPHASPDPPDPTPIPTHQQEVTPIPARYKECLKNHAASMGAHVVDGCGEFMPSGDHGTPEALKCAACDCHRNFHRKEIDGAETTPTPPPPPKHRFVSPTTMVNFGGAAAESSSEDLDMYQPGGQPSSRKRFRTKFRQDQKERMHELAVRLGWRIQKEDEEEVQQFCREVGVKRQVLKVWMHNNKQAIKKREQGSDDG